MEGKHAEEQDGVIHTSPERCGSSGVLEEKNAAGPGGRIPPSLPPPIWAQRAVLVMKILG